MRQAFIPDELEAQIESLRGDTPFETWLALAIQEKTFWGTRFTMREGTLGELDEMWMAVVQLEDGHEVPLLWRVSSTLGVEMMPVIVYHEADIEMWKDRMGLEINLMDGPSIYWRHFEGGEFVEWLRAPQPEDAD